MGREEGALRLTVCSCPDGSGQKDFPRTKETYLSGRELNFRGKHQAAFCCRLNKATKYASLGNCALGKADVYVDLLGVKGRKPLSFLSPFSFREKKSGGRPRPERQSEKLMNLLLEE